MSQVADVVLIDGAYHLFIYTVSDSFDNSDNLNSG